MRAWLAYLLVFLVSSRLLGQDSSQTAPRLDPDLPYQASRSHAVTYDVDFSVVVTPPYKCKSLKVWLPIPTSDRSQEVGESSLSSFPIAVEPSIGVEPVYGNKFAFFEFDSPHGAQIIRHQFEIKVWQLNWNIDSSKLVEIQDWPDDFDKYRRSETQAVVVDDRFRKLLGEIVPSRSNPAHDFNRVIDWVHSNFQYDHHNASLRASSVHGLQQRRGHCSDYHGFCASVGRALGVPTRITYGVNPFPKNSPSHCKLEAFLPPYGWVSFDVSETQKLMDSIRGSETLDDATKGALIEKARSRMASGFRDNTWFLQTRGSDYDLIPKASGRVPVVRTAYIEADGLALPDPDPSDAANQTYHAWMTVHQYAADKAVTYPFSDWTSLEQSELSE
jgi:transglutaminase-like putative cysteine protease